MKPISFNLELHNHQHMLNLCGELDKNLDLIKKQLDIEIRYRGNDFQVIGDEKSAIIGKRVLEFLFILSQKEVLDIEQVHMAIQEHKNKNYEENGTQQKKITFHTRSTSKFYGDDYAVEENN